MLDEQQQRHLSSGGVGDGALSGFREVACIQHTTFLTQQTHNSFERVPRGKKKIYIFFSVDIVLTGQTALKGTHRRNAYEYVPQC